MTAAVARNDLVGVRFTPSEQDVLDRLVAHFEATNPGMRFTKQMIVRAAVTNYARSLGVLEAQPSPPSQPRVKAEPKTKKR